jgi:hypothetical protein
MNYELCTIWIKRLNPEVKFNRKVSKEGAKVAKIQTSGKVESGQKKIFAGLGEQLIVKHQATEQSPVGFYEGRYGYTIFHWA